MPKAKKKRVAFDSDVQEARMVMEDYLLAAASKPKVRIRLLSSSVRRHQSGKKSGSLRECATATTQAAGAERLRRGQLPQCAPRPTSVRRGAVQPLWRPATGRVLRL